MSDSQQPSIEISLEQLRGAAEEHKDRFLEARQLEAQAFSIRTEAERVYIAQWFETYGQFKRVAGERIGGMAFLGSAIDFCSVKVPLPHTLQQPYDRDVAEDLFDSIRPGEPIITEQTYGLIASEPKTVVRDLQNGIGLSLAIDVVRLRRGGKRPRGAREAELSLERRYTSSVRVGHQAVTGYLGSVTYRQTKESFGHIPMYRSNRSELGRAVVMAEAFNAAIHLGIDVARIEQQIATKGEPNREL
jgi:hypothetical protein